MINSKSESSKGFVSTGPTAPRRQFLSQSALALLGAGLVMEGCGGGGNGSKTETTTREVLEGLSTSSDTLSAFVTSSHDPGSLLSYPTNRGRQTGTDNSLNAAFVAYGISVSYQMLFDTYKRVVHSFFLTRDSLKRVKVPVNGKETVFDNSSWVAGTMRKQLLTAISLAKFITVFLSSGMADEAKSILGIKDDLQKGILYCSFMLIYNQHVEYACSIAGKPVDSSLLLPDDPSLTSADIDELMMTIADRIFRIPYGIPWSEGRDITKIKGATRGIDAEWMSSKMLDYMSQSFASYKSPGHEWNKDRINYQEYLDKKVAVDDTKFLGNGSWIDKSRKATDLAKGIAKDLREDFMGDLARELATAKKIPWSVRDIDQIEATAGAISAATDMFKYAAIGVAGGSVALSVGVVGGIIAGIKLRDSLVNLTDSLMDDYFDNDVKHKLDQFNAKFNARKKKELDEIIARLDKVIASSKKNGQSVPTKQLPVVTNPNTAETDILADSDLTPNTTEEYGPWPLGDPRATRSVSMLPACFDDAIDVLKLEFEKTIKSCPNLGYIKTSTGFSYFHADFAAIVRRDPSMLVAEFPAITSAQMMCTAPGYLPMMSDKPKNILEILQLPELKPLSSVSFGVSINVK